MTIVFEGFLSFRPGNQTALDVAQARLFWEFDKFVNLCGESAFPTDIGDEYLIAKLNDCAVGSGNCKLQLFDGGETHIRTPLIFTRQYEMYILTTVFFKEKDQFIVLHLKGNPLHHNGVKHIGSASLADCKDLLSNLISHLHPPPFCKYPHRRLHSDRSHCPRKP